MFDSRLKVKHLGLFLIGGAFVYFVAAHFMSNNSVVVSDTYEAPAENDLVFDDHDHIHIKSFHKETSKKRSISSEETAKLEKVDVSELHFKTKSKEIIELAEDYPKHKNKLMELVSAKDPFKEKGKEPKPHTVHDIKQQQEGALRVLALRVLMQNESKESFKVDLKRIIQESEDPTMSKIAEAVLKSVEEGRPFFEDFSDAITQL